MSTLFLTFIVLSAVAILLILVLKLKLNAFIALLLTSIYVGLLTGMPLGSITRSIQEGMAGTLGFVATVVGLGAIFGQMLESSGGAESLAHYLVKRFGKERAPWAMVTTGFIVAIPMNPKPTTTVRIYITFFKLPDFHKHPSSAIVPTTPLSPSFSVSIPKYGR
jgi:Gnt-I system low-affinity gluconate transporter